MARVYSQEQWTKCRIEYAYLKEKEGSISRKALAEKHGINYKTLCNRIKDEEWDKPIAEWITSTKNKLEDDASYNPIMCLVAYELAKTGAQNVEIYKALNISRSTFYSWTSRGNDLYKKAFHESIIEGQEMKQAMKIAELDKHGQDEIIETIEKGHRGENSIYIEKEILKRGSYKATELYLKEKYLPEKKTENSLDSMSTEELEAMLKGLD